MSRAAQVQGQHGLDGPQAKNIVPIMPGNFIRHEQNGQHPADRAPGAVG